MFSIYRNYAQFMQQFINLIIVQEVFYLEN